MLLMILARRGPALPADSPELCTAIARRAAIVRVADLGVASAPL